MGQLGEEVEYGSNWVLHLASGTKQSCDDVSGQQEREDGFAGKRWVSQGEDEFAVGGWVSSGGKVEYESKWVLHLVSRTKQSCDDLSGTRGGRMHEIERLVEYGRN